MSSFPSAPSIPSTNDVTVAMIAAALQVAKVSGDVDPKTRIRKFQEAYRGIYEVVNNPKKDGG